MKNKIKFLKPFSDIVGKNELEIEFIGSTLEDLLNELINQYPNSKKELFKENGELTEYVNIFVNDKPISALKGINSELKNNDEILFFMPVSGG
jgi:MoaD family protein